MAQLALAVIIFDQKMVFCMTAPRGVGGERGPPCSPEHSPHSSLPQQTQFLSRALGLGCAGSCPFWNHSGETTAPSWPSATPTAPLMLPKPGLQHWTGPSSEFLWKHQKGKTLRALVPGKKCCSLWGLWAAWLPVAKGKEVLERSFFNLSLPSLAMAELPQHPWVICSSAQPAVPWGIRENIQTLISLSAI